MKSLLDLNLIPVWVNPDHLVSSAKHLMAGHQMRAIAVMDGQQIRGVITNATALATPEKVLCANVMSPTGSILDPTTSIVRAAQSFVDGDLDYIVVMDERRFYGILTGNMLLKELRRSWDPLTNLGWSDRVREWGVDKLSRSEEISIIFIDLDKFGKYNKTYGHIVGDRVLKTVAALLKSNVDPETDELVRYGGDEFVIGTTRKRQDAEMLMEKLSRASGQMFVDEAFEPVTFSLGIAGGQRSNLRPDIHVASMLDELINSASKDCLARKQKLPEFA